MVKLFRNSHGFTLIELLVVIVILSILFLIAIPATKDWRKNSQYQTVAREMVLVLRKARSDSISRNKTTEVEIVDNSYKIDGRVVGTFPSSVKVTADNTIISFNPSGSADNTITITIADNADVKDLFEVTVASKATGLPFLNKL